MLKSLWAVIINQVMHCGHSPANNTAFLRRTVWIILILGLKNCSNICIVNKGSILEVFAMFYMVYKLLYDPDGLMSFTRLFYYISSRSIFAAITAFVLVLALGRPIINFLFRKGARDCQGMDEGLFPENKQGTPQMGGVLLILGSMISVLLWCNLADRFTQVLLGVALAFGGCGILDDILKVARGNPGNGLSRYQKIGMQGVFSLIFGLIVLSESTTPFPSALITKLYIPFYKFPIADLPFLVYLVFIVLLMLYASNAVNLTDGMDGLAVVPALFTFALYGVYAWILGNEKWSDYFLFYLVSPGVKNLYLYTGELSIFCAALIGACLGFLWFNSYPAEVFMGDTGSLYLGGIIGSLIVMVKQEILFFLVGGIFLAEFVSVLVQDYIGIRLLGRRIFFRAPLHHTFQHRGLAETKIVVRFWIISGILTLIALSTIKSR